MNTERPLKVLVINDDGVGSPLLIPFLDVVAKQTWCGELRVVVPATEQSWVAQCITRFRDLEATPHSFGKHPGFLVNGTAADCSTIGIHNLYADKPDVVLSGVNMGWNAALPFFMSSGTIGGAAEAFLTKVPALALSLFLPDPIYRTYASHNRGGLEPYADRWPIAAEVSAKLITKLLRSNFPTEADIFSINLPWDVTLDTAASITALAEAHFEKLFIEPEKYHFKHKLQGVYFETPRKHSKHENRLPTEYPPDVRTLEQGKITITPICYHFTTHVSENFRKGIEER